MREEGVRDLGRDAEEIAALVLAPCFALEWNARVQSLAIIASIVRDDFSGYAIRASMQEVASGFAMPASDLA
nr:hypothetical protein BN993_04649 [Virgibacillus halodenitrificans]